MTTTQLSLSSTNIARPVVNRTLREGHSICRSATCANRVRGISEGHKPSRLRRVPCFCLAWDGPTSGIRYDDLRLMPRRHMPTQPSQKERDRNVFQSIYPFTSWERGGKTCSLPYGRQTSRTNRRGKVFVYKYPRRSTSFHVGASPSLLLFKGRFSSGRSASMSFIQHKTIIPIYACIRPVNKRNVTEKHPLRRCNPRLSQVESSYNHVRPPGQRLRD